VTSAVLAPIAPRDNALADPLLPNAKAPAIAHAINVDLIIVMLHLLMLVGFYPDWDLMLLRRTQSGDTINQANLSA
jgi:hypothetical protein